MTKEPKEPDISYTQTVTLRLQIPEIDIAVRAHINSLAANGLVPKVKDGHQIFLWYIIASEDEGGLLGVKAEYTPQERPHDQ